MDSKQLFEGILHASEEEEATCGKLAILCRTRDREKITFLITNCSEVVTQFKMSKHLLKDENPIERFFNQIQKLVPDRPNVSSINDLKAGMKKVKVTGEILEIQETRRVITRFGLTSFVANAIIGDKSGTITLPLWNKQINEFSAGDRINVSQANVVNFRGNLQLRVTRTGQLTRASESSFRHKQSVR